MAVSVFDLPKKIVQDRELALAIDEDCRASRRRLAEPGASMGNTEQTISRDRFGLAFENERSDRLDTRIALRQQAGRLADEDRSRLGGLLESGGDIGCITDHRIIHRQILGDRTEDNRARVDANSHRQLRALGIGRRVAFGERPLYGKSCQQGTAHMVLVSERRSEQGHEPVAGKLRCSPPIATHLGEARFEKRANKIAHSLGSEAFSHWGRVDDVAEHHCDTLHFAGKSADGPEGLRLQHIWLRRGRITQTRWVEWHAALPTEFVFRRVAGAA